MSDIEETNSRLLRRWFQEVWNDRKEAVIDELMPPDVKAYGLDDNPVDREGFRATWRFFLDTFDSLVVDVQDVIAQGDKTAARIVVTGVHSGDGLGVAPTGKPVRFDVQAFTTWKDGKIVEGWNVVDMAAVKRQIGV
jgi:predicted ester cyclase